MNNSWNSELPFNQIVKSSRKNSQSCILWRFSNFLCEHRKKSTFVIRSKKNGFIVGKYCYFSPLIISPWKGRISRSNSVKIAGFLLKTALFKRELVEKRSNMAVFRLKTTIFKRLIVKNVSKLPVFGIKLQFSREISLNSVKYGVFQLKYAFLTENSLNFGENCRFSVKNCSFHAISR